MYDVMGYQIIGYSSENIDYPENVKPVKLSILIYKAKVSCVSVI